MSIQSGTKNYPTVLGNPVDSIARRVISKGTSFTPKLKEKPGMIHTDILPPVEPVPAHLRQWIGTRQYRVTVIGLLVFDSDKGHKWLVRCVCGKYESRNHQTWRKWRAFDDSCRVCRQNEFLKNKHKSNADRDRQCELLQAEHQKMKPTWIED